MKENVKKGITFNMMSASSGFVCLLALSCGVVSDAFLPIHKAGRIRSTTDEVSNSALLQGVPSSECRRKYVPSVAARGGPSCARDGVVSSSRLHSSVGGGSGGDDAQAWNGDVVSNSPGGVIRGCTVQPASEDSMTEWVITIDGVAADLGRFSEAIYKKIVSDARKERFQGFRPGTIPPQLEPTYRAFAMDECARETVLEAMQQNNIRPFETARTDMVIGQVEIPPPRPSAGKKKKNKKRRKSKRKSGGAKSGGEEEGPANAADEVQTASPEPKPQWLSFDTMKEALAGGWRPGQSFSFVAENVKGQRVKDESETTGSTPLGLNF